MRSIKELLELMLQHQHLFINGLCAWIIHLYGQGHISSDEYLLLKSYIKNNKPSKWSGLNAFCHNLFLNEYYWTIGKISYRIKWIEKHIKLNS